MVTAGRVLSLGYFDHPPAAGGCPGARRICSGTEAPVAVRLPFILLFALSQFLVWRIGCLVADRRAGFWAAVALNLAPVFGVTTASWVLPDGPLDAALLGAALCLLHALPADGRQATSVVGGGRAMRRAGAVFQVFRGADHCGRGAVSAAQRAASPLVAPAGTLPRRRPRAAGVFAGARLERHAWLGVVRVPGRAGGGVTVPAACWRCRPWAARRCSCCPGCGCR